MLIILISIILSSFAVFVAAKILPGIYVDSYTTAIVVAIVLGFINTFIRPLLLILTLPINILTLGLFTLVIMALCVMLASAIVPGFRYKLLVGDGFCSNLCYTEHILGWILERAVKTERNT